MKVVIFAGGLGTRLSEETEAIPKPMVKVGNMPILWHIMKIYHHQGFSDFVICLGYRGYSIKEFFHNYFLYTSDVTINTKKDSLIVHNTNSEDWNVTLVDTGADTGTGGRLARVKHYLGDEPFMLTYGDGVSDINVHELIKHHKQANNMLTMTLYEPVGRFGSVALVENSSTIKEFVEKPIGSGNLINAGFFVCQPEIFNYYNESSGMFEDELHNIAKLGLINGYHHTGFWHAMDTLRDKNNLNNMWNNNQAKWKIW